ncbi:helix-turn-helix domain-containing protein [Rhodopirellula sallentina]|uniref:Transcriptional regulator n=1 Tax=Rhodopirellula sallentina SM41 TaxID=1263870 RepID=M5U2V4_9BACT|nr:helix-turn-helix domain-containing protein [Rhodopirellula sallentina]EMI52186.1 transcriptional regulator [Rhodopirellula sallentina SM41]
MTAKTRRKPKRQTADRFAVLNAFADFTAKELRRSELLVWLTLYRDTREGVATTSQRDIANRCGIDRKTVERSIASLIDRGLLIVVKSGGFRRGSASYRVLPMSRERLDALPRSRPNP